MWRTSLSFWIRLDYLNFNVFIYAYLEWISLCLCLCLSLSLYIYIYCVIRLLRRVFPFHDTYQANMSKLTLAFSSRKMQIFNGLITPKHTAWLFISNTLDYIFCKATEFNVSLPWHRGLMPFLSIMENWIQTTQTKIRTFFSDNPSLPA